LGASPHAMDSVLLHPTMSNTSTRRFLALNPTGSSAASIAPSYHTDVPFPHTLLNPTPTGMSTVSRAPSYRSDAEADRARWNNSLPDRTLDDIPESPPPAYSDIGGSETILEQGPRRPFETSDFAQDFYAAGAEPLFPPDPPSLTASLQQRRWRSPPPPPTSPSASSASSGFLTPDFGDGETILEYGSRRPFQDASGRPLSQMSDFAQEFYAADDEPLFPLPVAPSHTASLQRRYAHTRRLSDARFIPLRLPAAGFVPPRPSPPHTGPVVCYTVQFPRRPPLLAARGRGTMPFMFVDEPPCMTCDGIGMLFD